MQTKLYSVYRFSDSYCGKYFAYTGAPKRSKRLVFRLFADSAIQACDSVAWLLSLPREKLIAKI